MMRQGVHSGWQARTAVGPTPDSFAKMRPSTRERFGAQNDRSSPQNAKMPNKLVEYVAAPFPLTLSLSKGERSHNLPLMVRQAHQERGRSRLHRRGGQDTPLIAQFNAEEHEVTQS